MATVIERHGYEIDNNGYVHYDDKQSSHEIAEKIAERKLDKRHNYAIIDGAVHRVARWSQACSGCYEGFDSYFATGSGCHECGYTGRRRQAHWVPLIEDNE